MRNALPIERSRSFHADAVLADIKALTETPNIVAELGPAFEKYNEEQLTTVKLPGSSQAVSTTSTRLREACG